VADACALTWHAVGGLMNKQTALYSPGAQLLLLLLLLAQQVPIACGTQR
jgi:hypothetical protein